MAFRNPRPTLVLGKLHVDLPRILHWFGYAPSDNFLYVSQELRETLVNPLILPVDFPGENLVLQAALMSHAPSAELVRTSFAARIDLMDGLPGVTTALGQ